MTKTRRAAGGYETQARAGSLRARQDRVWERRNLTASAATGGVAEQGRKRRYRVACFLPSTAVRMHRAFAWLPALAMVLLVAGGPGEVASAGEDPAASEADLRRLLEGFAPLAQHGEWTRLETREPPEFDDIPEESRRGLQEAFSLKFSALDDSKAMMFRALRFETTAQAEAFLAAQRKEVREAWKQPVSSPAVSVWQQDVSEGAGKDGALNGYALASAVEFSGRCHCFALQHFRVNRLCVQLMFANCAHVSRDVVDAFIDYALKRGADPSLEPPPSPDLRIAMRDVTVLLRDEGGEPVAMAEAVAHSLSSGGAGPVIRLVDRGKVALPAELTKLRIGHAAGPDGRPLPLLAAEIIVASRESEATVTFPRGEACRIRLIGPRGKPFAGGRVRTLSQELVPQFPINVHVGGRVRGEDVSPEETFSPIGDGKGTTGPEGEVLLPVDPRYGSRVVVDAGEGFFSVVEDAPPGRKSKTIALRPAWVLHVALKDCDGTPVAGRVEVHVQGEHRSYDTAADGRAAIGPLPMEAVHIRAPGGASDEMGWTEVRPAQGPVVIRLTSHVLRLRVLGVTGAQVPRYWVEVRTERVAYGMTAEGATTLLLPPERCSVEVREAADADGRPVNLAAARAMVAPAARELTLRMLPGLRLTGTVRTASGQPVEGAEVWAGRFYDVYARTKTNPAGWYELVGLEPVDLTLNVRPPPGLAPPRPRGVRPTRAGAPVDFTLPHVVPVTVLDWQGLPVRGAWVRVKVVGADPEAGTYPIEGHTDENGVAHLANLYAEQELRVVPQYSVDLASMHRPWDGSPVTLELERARTIEVRVLDGRGPVAGARVEVEGGMDIAPATGPDGRSDVLLPYRPVRLRAQRSPSDPWSPWVEIQPQDRRVELRVPDATR